MTRRLGRLNNKRGRPSKYRKWLKNNSYWNKVKRKVRIRDDFQCVECQSKINLETHHISYSIDGKSILGKELDHIDWIVTLCENCHEKVHENLKHPLCPKNINKVSVKNYDRN